MNILFLTLLDICDIDERNIYADLMREFAKHNHKIYIVSPSERRNKQKTRIINSDLDDWHRNIEILKIKTGNIQKTNIFEKGISTVLIEQQITNGIKKYYNNIKFDFVLYSTPPITIVKPIKYIKEKDNARTYLMLKDIFPQNAVDLGLMSTTGVKGILYRYFKRKEKELYSISNRIGCMSPANVEYILKHNPEIEISKVEVCPNSIEVKDIMLTDKEKHEIREKYRLPIDRKIFVYGGNLGKPQGISFIIECLRACQNRNIFFLIIGSGTEYDKLNKYVSKEHPTNVILMESIPRDDYERMIAACDVGVIFLDHRFTIPNFPSRVLPYMQAALPIIACTDSSTDIGIIIEAGGFGWRCESNNVESVKIKIEEIAELKLDEYSKKSLEYLLENYQVSNAYKIIIGHNT